MASPVHLHGALAPGRAAPAAVIAAGMGDAPDAVQVEDRSAPPPVAGKPSKRMRSPPLSAKSLTVIVAARAKYPAMSATPRASTLKELLPRAPTPDRSTRNDRRAAKQRRIRLGALFVQPAQMPSCPRLTGTLRGSFSLVLSIGTPVRPSSPEPQ
jgi:hypothetical protein